MRNYPTNEANNRIENLFIFSDREPISVGSTTDFNVTHTRTPIYLRWSANFRTEQLRVFGCCCLFLLLLLLCAFILQENKHHISSYHRKLWCTHWKNFHSIARKDSVVSRYHFIHVCFVRVHVRVHFTLYVFVFVSDSIVWIISGPDPSLRIVQFVCCQLLLFRNWKVCDCEQCSNVWKLVFYLVELELLSWGNVFCVDAVCGYAYICGFVHSKIDDNAVIKRSNISVFLISIHLSKGQFCQKTIYKE